MSQKKGDKPSLSPLLPLTQAVVEKMSSDKSGGPVTGDQLSLFLSEKTSFSFPFLTTSL